MVRWWAVRFIRCGRIQRTSVLRPRTPFRPRHQSFGPNLRVDADPEPPDWCRSTYRGSEPSLSETLALAPTPPLRLPLQRAAGLRSDFPRGRRRLRPVWRSLGAGKGHPTVSVQIIRIQKGNPSVPCSWVSRKCPNGKGEPVSSMRPRNDPIYPLSDPLSDHFRPQIPPAIHPVAHSVGAHIEDGFPQTTCLNWYTHSGPTPPWYSHGRGLFENFPSHSDLTDSPMNSDTDPQVAAALASLRGGRPVQMAAAPAPA
jgi:hypothetical protein